MSLYRYDDTLGGFNYDVIREIARQKGLPLKFHPLTNISQGLDGLDSHKYDILVADVAPDYRHAGQGDIYRAVVSRQAGARADA